jgi:D-alanine-D-alanine ligase
VVVGRAGVATPRSITLGRDAFRELGADAIFSAIDDELPIPLVVKPAQGGSAQGVTIVKDRSEMPRAMVEAYTYWDVALIEQQIIGTEVTVGVLDTGDGPVALPGVEIEPLSGFYSYEARYNAGETRFYTPARVSDEVAARAAEAALTAHTALGLRHLSRVDFIIDGAGTPWFLEANVLPGLTETSLLPQALEAAGHDLGWVYMTLAEAARRADSA